MATTFMPTTKIHTASYNNNTMLHLVGVWVKQKLISSVAISWAIRARDNNSSYRMEEKKLAGISAMDYLKVNLQLEMPNFYQIKFLIVSFHFGEGKMQQSERKIHLKIVATKMYLDKRFTL